MELLERDDQLTQLHAALDRASAGEGRVVLVRGEAGIGKTALVRAFVDQISDRAHVLWGACDDLFTPSPLAPVWDMTDTEPGLATALAGEPLGVFRALADLLSRGLRPTAVVIEDTHWADEATLDLIRYLGRRIEDKHGILILTYRDEEVPEDGGLRTVFGDLPSAALTRIRLQPLSEDAVLEMAASQGVETDEALGSAGGNPLLVTELLADPARPVPSSIQDAYRTRLGRLSPDARQLARLVSVVPTSIEQWLLAEVAPDSGAAMAECQQRGILHTTGATVGFRHELARLAVETSLTADVRQQYNQAVLDALIAADADPARIVHHAQAAGDVQALIDHGPRAAISTAEAEMHQESLSYQRMLDPHLAAIETPLQAALLESRIDSERHSGSTLMVREVANRAVRLYRQENDFEGAGRVLGMLSENERRLGHLDLAEQAATEAAALLSEVEGHPGLSRIYASWAFIHNSRGDNDHAQKFSARAVELADEENDMAAKSWALTYRGVVLQAVDYASAKASFVDSINTALSGNHLDALQDAYELGSVVAMNNLDVRTADEWTSADISLCRDLGLTNSEAKGLVNRAWIKLDRGYLRDAERDAEAALEIRLANNHPYRDEPLMALALIRLRLGEPWKGVLDDMVSATADLGDERRAIDWAVRAEAAWLTTGTLDDPSQPLWAINVLRHQDAREPSTIAYWLWKMGILNGPIDVSLEPHRLEIEGNWPEAAEKWDELGMPYDKALVLAAGDIAAKLDALSIFDQLGAKPMAARVRTELRRAGVKGVPRGPQTTTRDHGAGLTARQQEVLDLLVQGLSNTEIADELFISTRTAEHHVAAVIAKLEADDRYDAAAKASERGIVTV